jgi:tetratricopeptide (TPR) repeat protein/predicted choloylglycine hydrolase
MNCVHRTVRVLVCAMVLLVLLSGSAQSSSELSVEQIGDRFQAGKGYMEIMGPVAFMHLKGTPYEMGLQHGTLLAQLYPPEQLLQMRDELDPLQAEVSGFERFVQGFKKFYFQYKLAPWIRRNIPDDFLQELEGLVLGVSGGQDTDPMDVIMGNVSQDLGMTFGCTSVVAFGGATASGALYHARNLDNISMMDWAQYGYVVVYEPDQGYPFITYTYPTQVGVMQAMNNQGITVSMNYSLVDQADNSLDGMAMLFLLRQIVQHASSLDEAVEIVLGTPRTFGMNIVISDSKIPDAVVLEVDANRFAVRKTEEGLLSATNRYHDEYMGQFQTSGWLASARRDQRLAQFLSGHYGEIQVESMVELLRDRGQPGSGEYEGLLDGINNAGSMLSCVFSPEEQIMWVSIPGAGRGAPDNEFYAFSLAKALAGEKPAVFSRNIGPTPEDDRLTNWLLVREAALALSQNRLAEALDYLDQLDPEFSQAEAAINLKANTHLRLGSQAEAQRYFRLLAEKPYVSEPYYLLEALVMLGSLHDNAGERDAAVECYQAALEVDVADLAGNTPFYWQLAEVGVRRPVYLEFPGPSYYFTTRDSALARFFQAPEAIPCDADLYREYEGMQIAKVRILGAHRTDEELIARILQLEEGTPLDFSRLAAGKRRLDALGALDQVQIYVVPVGDDAVDVVVRISEGFGLYLDPVQFVVENALNLSPNTIAMRYYNVAGTLASIGGGYSFGPSRLKTAYLTFPLGTWPASLRYQSQTICTKLGWGTHKGSEYSLERKDASFSSSLPIGEQSAVGFTLGLSQSQVEDISTSTDLIVPSGDYVTLGITAQTGWPGTTTWTREGTSLQAGGAILVNRQDLAERFVSGHIRARNLSYLGGGFVVRLEISGAWAQHGTPFDRRPRLGGGGQLGANSPMFVGEMNLYSNLELQRYFTHDLAAHVNYEAAKIWEDSSDLARSHLLHSVGVGLTYQTPIGLKIRAQYSKNLSLEDTRSFSVGIVSSF